MRSALPSLCCVGVFALSVALASVSRSPLSTTVLCAAQSDTLAPSRIPLSSVRAPSMSALPTPIVLPTPGVDALLLIRKAITAKPFDVASADGGCTGQSTELHRKPFIIGVTGGTASGKTTVCDEIKRHLGDRATLLQMDRFYKTLPAGKPASEHNFDIPDAFDWPLFVETLQKLSTGQSVQVPEYSFATHQRLEKWDTFHHADVILVEGILVLHDPRIREQFDLKVYVEADADTRLARRSQKTHSGAHEQGRKEECLAVTPHADLVV